MRRPPTTPRKTPVFVFVEGQSDQAFASFLQHCFDKDRKPLNLDIEPGSGGDTLVVVETAIRHLKKGESGKDYYRKIVLLDADRIEEDKRHGRDAHAKAKKHGLEIILQDPNLEGLLLRMHPGNESKKYQPKDVKKELKKFWPEYDKSKLNEYLLDKRFTFEDFRQAAKYDQQLQRLITILENAVAKAV